MKNLKVKIYTLTIVVLVILFFGVSALCNQCSKTPATESETSESVEEQISEQPTETSLSEETITKESESLPEISTSETETASAQTTSNELKAPTIQLKIYEGPTYSSADNVCYYRIEAIVTGNPFPDVSFSKDDSFGAWGKTKCQVNLSNPGESYTLTAVAKNSEGVASDSITLTWGCEESAETDGTDTSGGTINIQQPHVIPPITINRLTLHPKDIGYIVWPNGINTDTMIFGDSINNVGVEGFFGFGILAEYTGRTVNSVLLELKTYKYWGNPSSDFGLILGFMGTTIIFPLDSSDWNVGIAGFKTFNRSEEPLVW